MSRSPTSSHPSRRTWRRVIGSSVALLALTLGACSSDVSGPATQAASGYLTVSAAVNSNRKIDFKVMYPKLPKRIPTKSTRGDTTVQKFTVDPLVGRLIEFGKKSGNVLAIPANTLCATTGNTYGPTEWLKPCTLANSSISFEVRSWTDAEGHPHAQFYPAMRFNPSAAKPVMLFFQDPLLTNYTNVRIPYCNAQNVCVDEAVNDPALETYVTPLPLGGYYVYRQLRHFSGYNVTAF